MLLCAVSELTWPTGYGLKHAVRVETVGQLVDAFEAACARAGPTLIEAMLP